MPFKKIESVQSFSEDFSSTGAPTSKLAPDEHYQNKRVFQATTGESPSILDLHNTSKISQISRNKAQTFIDSQSNRLINSYQSSSSKHPSKKNKYKVVKRV